MILMDQPFAALVKELFDLQKYPEIPRAPSITSPAAGRPVGGRGGATTPPCRRRAALAARYRWHGAQPEVDAARPAAPPPPAAPAQLPYDVTGWTLPLQMGVEVVAVSQPVPDAARSAMRKLDRIEPIAGKVEGAGPVFAFSHNSNASLRAVNDLLAAGATVSFSKTGGTIYTTAQPEFDPAKERRRCRFPQRSPRRLAREEAAHRPLRTLDGRDR